MTLYGGPTDNTGASTLSFDVAKSWLDARAPTSVYRVHGRRIDDVVREAALGRVDVIKIDVEGAEFDVLKGALQTLQRFHPKVIVEVNPPLLATMHASADGVVSFLKEAGYTHSRQLDGMDVADCQCRDKTPAILPVLPIRGEVNLGGDAVGTLQ